MAKYQIPDAYKSGFILISNLKKDDMDLICETIRSAEVGVQPEDLVSLLQGKTSISYAELLQIFKTIFSLINLNIDGDGKTDELIIDLVNSFSENISGRNYNEPNALQENLSRILSTQGKIKHTIKAYNLLSENEKVYLESRIISDIRLVFDTDLETKTRGAVLLHQLKLTYKQDGDVKESFIALDSNDLNDLKDSITRAIEKEKLILNDTFTKGLLFIKSMK